MRARASTLMVIWSAIPIAFAAVAFHNKSFLQAGTFAAVAAIVCVVAALARSGRPIAHKVGAGILVVLFIPFAAWVVRGLAFAWRSGYDRVADSPAGYIVEVVGLSFYLASLVGFAIAVWRFRSIGQDVVSNPPAA